MITCIIIVLCETDFYMYHEPMVATGQEMVKEKILQGQGNVRELYSGSGKIGILKKSQGKLNL